MRLICIFRDYEYAMIISKVKLLNYVIFDHYFH